MIIVLKPGTKKEEYNHIIDRVTEYGFKPHPIVGDERTVIACVGDERGKAQLQQLESLDYVENVLPILKPFKLASKETKPRTVVKVGNVEFGNSQFVVIAGPCSVESQGSRSSSAPNW
jgi:3-deoxy-7-phosphoheptulonate synthase